VASCVHVKRRGNELSKESFLDRLGKLYLEGDQEKIETFILGKIADVIAEGGDELALCTVYNELGGYYRGISRFSDSLAAFDKAARCLEARGLGQSVQAATVMINRAGTCRLMGDSDTALKLYRRSGAILDANPGADRYLIASLFNNLSLSYIQSSRLNEALVEAQKGYEIMKTIPGSERELVTSLINLATISLQVGDPEAAEVQMDQAMALFEIIPPASYVHYAAALNLLANIRAHRGNNDGAQKALQEALDFTHHFFGENIEAASTKQSLATICSAMGDNAGAYHWQQAALEEMERLLGVEDDRTNAARKLLEQYRVRG
jgi:tetratricopeptide (TPR) repeat protein